MKIVTYSPKDDATNWYRAKFPLQALAEKGLAQFEMHFGEDLNTSLDCDTVIFQRTGLTHIPLMEKYKTMGKRVIYDIDDDIPNLDPTNPANLVVSPNRATAASHHVALLNTKDMTLVMEGLKPLLGMKTEDVAEMAVRNFDAIIHSMKIADCVTVSTVSLRKTYSGWGVKNIVVLKNQEKEGEWRGVVRSPLLGRVVLGWAGGISHAFTDIKPISKAVIQVMRENPNVHLHIIGVPELKGKFFDDKGITERVFTEPWTTWESYKELVAEFDIALAPSFSQKKFAMGKSDIRCLQAWIKGIPTVASELTYGESTRDSGGGFVTEFDWYTAMTKLVKDGDLRRSFGKSGETYVLEQRTYEKNTEAWYQCLRS